MTTANVICILYSVICLRGNGVIRRTQKVIQGDDNGHVGRPCEVSLAPPYPEPFASYGTSTVLNVLSELNPLYSVICLRGNGVIRRTRKVIQGDDNGHVGRPC